LPLFYSPTARRNQRLNRKENEYHRQLIPANRKKRPPEPGRWIKKIDHHADQRRFTRNLGALTIVSHIRHDDFPVKKEITYAIWLNFS
jgi:hypothetical protein